MKVVRNSIVLDRVTDSRLLRNDENIDELPFRIPMGDLQLFVNRLLEANFPEFGLSKSGSTASSVANKILRVRTNIHGILAPFYLPTSPVLDMLLDLFINEQSGRKVSISDAAVAGRCPPTTGLRWVGVLANAGLVQRKNDASDQRRSFVSLTDQGRQVALRCIEACVTN